jgi:hypothetical protein
MSSAGRSGGWQLVAVVAVAAASWHTAMLGGQALVSHAAAAIYKTKTIEINNVHLARSISICLHSSRYTVSRVLSLHAQQTCA